MWTWQAAIFWRRAASQHVLLVTRPRGVVGEPIYAALQQPALFPANVTVRARLAPHGEWHKPPYSGTRTAFNLGVPQGRAAEIHLEAVWQRSTQDVVTLWRESRTVELVTDPLECIRALANPADGDLLAACVSPRLLQRKDQVWLVIPELSEHFGSAPTDPKLCALGMRFAIYRDGQLVGASSGLLWNPAPALPPGDEDPDFEVRVSDPQTEFPIEWTGPIPALRSDFEKSEWEVELIGDAAESLADIDATHFWNRVARLPLTRLQHDSPIRTRQQ